MPSDSREVSISARVPLAGLGEEISRLGFGTSALASRVSRRDSLRLLGSALQHGITHFDTARSYGFGEAESVLGDFVHGRRGQLTLTTKVGILPPRPGPWLSAAKAAARALVSAVPLARSQVRERAAHLVPPPRFDTAAMTASLETSLRALRTDHVDFLLLHEPRVDVLRSDEPLAFLQRVQQQGKAKHFGVATDTAGASRVLASRPELAHVLQLPCASLAHVPEHEQLASGRATFLHSCLGPLATLRDDLRANRALAAEWSQSLNLDITAPGTLERLTLLATADRHPHTAILFTSTNPGHIRENAAALGATASSDQLEMFRRLVHSQAVPR